MRDDLRGFCGIIGHKPDIIRVAEGSRCKITEKRLEGPPDLIVEIFSPGTERTDRDEKFDLYERCGVRDYWMLDPIEEYVEVYFWQEGRFMRQGVFKAGKPFISAVLGGKTVDVTSIFA
jgi:Uma2 family endonuclease